MENYDVSVPLWTNNDSLYEGIPDKKETSSPGKEKKDLKHTNVVGNVCEQCRKSKVKCDRQNPCARCVRLGLPCTRTPPSRRGRKRTKTMQSCEGLVLEAIDRSLKKERKEQKASAANGTAVVDEKVGPQVGVGIQFLVRTWIFNCFRRRSTFLLLKAAKLAMQCNFSLDDIIGEKDGPMSSLPSLMFSKTQSTLKIDDLIGKRLKLEDFDKSLVDLLRKHTGSVEDKKGSFYIFGRQVNKGYMRYYFTPDFERDFKTDEEEPDFCMRQPCWRPIFSTPASHDKIMKAIAESYVVFEAQEFQSFHSLHRGLRSYLSFEINSYKTTKKNRYMKTTKLNTPSTPKILSVQATRRTGDVVDVQVAISVFLKSTTASFLLFAMKVVESKKRKRKRRKKGQAKVTVARDIEETPFTVTSPKLSNVSIMPFLSPPMMMSPGDYFGSLPDTKKPEDNEATTFSFM